MLECLRAAGAKMPDITDENKNALLLRYAQNGAAGGVIAVLQAGANTDHRDPGNKDTPLHQAAGNGHAACGHTATVDALIQARADVNAVDGGKHSALHFAAMKLHASSVGALVQAKADVNAQRLLSLVKDLTGPEGMIGIQNVDAEELDIWHWAYLFSRALTIGGGTSEIQRNIIGEQLLGLPREPRAQP